MYAGLAGIMATLILLTLAGVATGNCSLVLIDDDTVYNTTSYKIYSIDETIIHGRNITISVVVSIHSFPSDILVMVGDDKPPGNMGGYGIKARLYTTEGGVLRLDMISSKGTDTYSFDYYLLADKTYVINIFMYTEYSGNGNGLATNFTIWWIDINGTRINGPFTKSQNPYTHASPLGLALGGAHSNLTVSKVKLAVDGYCPITGAPATITTTVTTTTTNTVIKTTTVTEAATTTVTETKTVSLAPTETSVPVSAPDPKILAIGAGLVFVLLLITTSIVRRR